MPAQIHYLGGAINHFVELVAPFMLLMSRTPRLLGGLIQLGFQGLIIASGNLSFLNYLTIVPAVACFDDGFLQPLFRFSPATLIAVAARRKGDAEAGSILRWSHLSAYVATACIAYLSVPVVANLLSASQVMNTSFSPFAIVNTYGAFGSVGKVRHEVIVQGSNHSDGTGPVWEEYQFPCKPGDIARAPCSIAPYHYRMDWLMWFAAMGVRVLRLS
jgi:hypothetical protein